MTPWAAARMAHPLVRSWLLELVTVHEYAHVCVHPFHLNYDRVSNRCESNPCVYDISVCEIHLELDHVVLTLSVGNPIYKLRVI